MTVKSWMDAQRHKGGPVKYLYDKLVELDSSSKVEDLEELIGDEETEGTILARIKALEDASQKNGEAYFFPLFYFFYIPSFFSFFYLGGDYLND